MALSDSIHLRGTRAAQPAATSVTIGLLYCVIDEGFILERSSGSAWEPYGPTGVLAPTPEQPSFVVTGGQVVWQGGLVFRVSAAFYLIAGAPFTSLEQDVTLDAADATFDRVDVIYLDADGVAGAVTGTPSATPSEPDVDPETQLKLVFVVVPATATEPAGITTATLYLENAGDPTEWDWTASHGTMVLNSTNNPRTGTTDIEGTAVAQNQYLQATIGSGSIDPAEYDLFAMYARPKASWNNGRGWSVRCYAGAVPVGAAVSVTNGVFGFDSATLAYQQVAIPVTLFLIPAGTLVTGVRITKIGQGTIGFYLDDISFIGEATSVPPGSGLTQAQADALYAPITHAPTHQSGGSDPIKLDDLATPDDNTDLNASTSRHGLLRKLNNVAGEFLNGQGIWTTPAVAVTLGKFATVRAATTANVTIATALNNGDTLDGVALVTGDLVLVKNQSALEENGVYVVGVTPARDAIFDTYNEHPGSLVAVQEGTAGADTLWLCTSNVGGTLNTTAIAFSQLTVSAAITQLTGDVTAGPGSGSQAATIANSAVTLAKQADLAADRIIGRANGAGTGVPTALTGTQVAVIVDAMVGDSGAGGTKGQVPAPAAGDAAASKFLKADGTWAAPAGAGLTALTGDVTASGAGSQAATIANGAVTPAKASTALKTHALCFELTNGGAVLAVGAQKLYLSSPWSGTITGARLIIAPTGSLVLDVWKRAFASFPPTVGQTITASAKPTISSGDTVEDTTLTGWGTTVTAGDVFEVNVDSVATCTWALLQLTLVGS